MTVPSNRTRSREKANGHSRTAKPQEGVSRDVEQELARQRAQKRREAGANSPVQFHKNLLIGDDWSTMSIKHIAQRVSVHEFTEPPQNVLDIGCGSGLWIIEAAKSWPSCNFFGLDIRNVQPDLSQANLGIECRDLSQRIKWVHGDFLEPLPFEDGYFDMVRIACIGLEVPEDYWQELFEECARVLKFGGVFEVFEEDLVFPAGRTRKPDAERTSNLNLRTVTIRRQSGERIRSDSMTSKLTTLTTQTQSSASNTSMVFTTQRMSPSMSGDSFLSSSSAQTDTSDELYTQDHAKLKQAWESMLSQRFRAHKLLTVLPFYLSSIFSNVSVHPMIQVILPPRSDQRDPASVLEDYARLDQESIRRWLREEREAVVHLSPGDASRRATVSSLGNQTIAGNIRALNSLHLSRQFNLISACKEAIWEAYQTLDADDRRHQTVREEPPKDDAREEFERDWKAWEDDMKDRIGTRSYVPDLLQWQDPDPNDTATNAGSATRSVRSSTVQSQSSTRGRDSLDSDSDPEKVGLCRVLRCFSALKEPEPQAKQ